MMKTIFIPFDDLGLGGVQTKIIDLANTLAKQKNTRVIIFLKHKTSFSRAGLLSGVITVWYCPWISKNFWKSRYYYFVVFLLFVLRPQATYISLEKTSVFVLRALRLLPWITTRIVINVDTYPAMDQLASVKVLHSLYNQAHAVIAPSQDTFRDLNERLKICSPPLIYIPNWYSGAVLTQVLSKTSDAVFAGRFDHQKQPDLCVQAIGELKKRGLIWNLDMYGEGPLQQEMSDLIRHQKLTTYVHIHVPIYSISPILRRTRFLFLFSRYEGLPLIALEAMACGCVIVAFNAPGVRNIVYDQKTGICKNSLNDIVKALEYVDSNKKLYHQMQKNALVLLQRNFSQKNRSRIMKLLMN